VGFTIFPYIALVHKTPVHRTIPIYPVQAKFHVTPVFFLETEQNALLLKLQDFHIFRQHSYSKSEGSRGRGGSVGHGCGDDGGSSNGSFGGSFGG
jgi:hypothetical protein